MDYFVSVTNVLYDFFQDRIVAETIAKDAAFVDAFDRSYIHDGSSHAFYLSLSPMMLGANHIVKCDYTRLVVRNSRLLDAKMPAAYDIVPRIDGGSYDENLLFKNGFQQLLYKGKIYRRK